MVIGTFRTGVLLLKAMACCLGSPMTEMAQDYKRHLSRVLSVVRDRASR